MGAKASTASGSGATLPAGTSGSGARSRTQSTSEGFGLLRSISESGEPSSEYTPSSGTPSTRERVGDRGRTRSLSSVPGVSNGAGTMGTMSIPSLFARTVPLRSHINDIMAGHISSEAEGSSPEDDIDVGPFASLGLSRVLGTHSLPAHLWSFNGFKCPVCSKLVLADDLECHLVICLTKPRINYNEDVLSEDKGECVICFEDLSEGDKIARLPCLCIYHKTCIDQWFQVNRSCPGHPYD